MARVWGQGGPTVEVGASALRCHPRGQQEGRGATPTKAPLTPPTRGPGLCAAGAVWAPMAAAACSPLLGDGSWCPRTLAGVPGGRASGRAHGTHREARDPLLASSFGPGPLRPLRSVTTRCPGEAAWPAGQLRLCPAAGAALVHLGARRGSVSEGGPGGGTLGGRGPDGRPHPHGPQPGHRLFFIQSIRPTAPLGAPQVYPSAAMQVSRTPQRRHGESLCHTMSLPTLLCSLLSGPEGGHRVIRLLVAEQVPGPEKKLGPIQPGGCDEARRRGGGRWHSGDRTDGGQPGRPCGGSPGPHAEAGGLAGWGGSLARPPRDRFSAHANRRGFSCSA